MASPLLTVSNLTMRFGGITALNAVSFAVPARTITALIGPNGAGKTTVFNCITGFYRPTTGEILLHRDREAVELVALLGGPLRARDFRDFQTLGQRLHDKMVGGSHQVARAGVARTFQNIRLFREMTVMENLLVAQHRRVNRNLLAGILRTRDYRRAEHEAVERARAWLGTFHLTDDMNRLAGELPYGHQRRLEIARAMCTDPTLLCLDEPAAGLNPRETRELSLIIQELGHRFGVTILLIEHDMSLVMGISHHVVVLDYGEVIAAGPPTAVQNHPRVLEAYLGVTT